MTTNHGGHQSLKQLADWYGPVALFDIEEEIDWSNSAEVVRTAFVASDCGNFAEIVSQMTSWPVMLVVSRNAGPVHALVQSPDGQLLDASGWVTRSELRRRYGAHKVIRTKPGPNILLTLSEDLDKNGFDEEIGRIVSAVRKLPWAPYNTDEFRAFSAKPFPGADIPIKDHAS